MKDKQDTKANSEQCVAAGQEEARPTPSDEPIEEKAEINKLLDEGYSVKQIIALGFKRRTVYHYAKLRMQPENDPAGSSQGEGPSGGQPGKGKQELIKLGSRDVIPPRPFWTSFTYHGTVMRLRYGGEASWMASECSFWEQGMLNSPPPVRLRL